MKRGLLLFVLALIPFIHHGQIIADHTVVDKYADIPQQWIDSVKTMLVDMAGESHSSTYIYGTNLLELLDSKFQVSGYGWDNTVPNYTDQRLRIGKQYTTGEEQYFTSQDSINVRKANITIQNSTGNEFSVMGFGWCWDMYYDQPPGGTIDPVYNVHWAGCTEGGIDGYRRFGLDAGDSVLTGNRVNMDTYFDAVEQYQQHCIDNGWHTKILYTTGPVDNIGGSNGTEGGFQRELKHDYIRTYIAQNSDRLLFDFADILCWNNSGEESVATWNDGGNLRYHSQIHPDNRMDYDASWNIIAHTEDGDHIGEVGSLRIAKAMWWMLARIAGWDGSTGTDTTPPTSPSNLTLTSSSESQVSFSWTASTDNVGVTGYNIYRSTILLGTTTELTYTDNTVSACANYTYTVSALDAATNESAQSSGLTANTDIQAPEGTITQPTCTTPTGTIEITAPTGTGIEYSIDGGSNWLTSTTFSGLTANASYTLSVRNVDVDASCVSSANFDIDPVPSPPSAPTISNATPENVCPDLSVNLTALVSSSTPTGGSIFFKTTNDEAGTNVTDPITVVAGSYYIFYQNQEGCYSSGTEVVVSINVCASPDITPTVIVTPNISHGVTTFNVFVKITELNMVNTSGNITINVPIDPMWDLDGPYNPLLTILESITLNNSEWSYSSDAINHIFTSTSVISAGGFSTFGFSISFDPGTNKGSYNITAQIVSGGGGEERVSNNVDSESLDYFQE